MSNAKTEIIVMNKNNDFRKVYSKGVFFVSSVLVTYFVKNKKKSFAYGITASKKVGIAVKRNRAKRIIKEAFKEFLPFVKGGYSVIFVARNKTGFVKMQDVKKSMRHHLYKAGLLIDEKDKIRET